MELTPPEGTDNFSLSAQAMAVWAKSDRRSGSWLPLVQHMRDTAEVAARLYDTWLAAGLHAQLDEVFPGGDEQARALFIFLAGAHDVGKASPVFVAQVETLAQRARAAGLDCPVMDELREDRRNLPHAVVSQYVFERWLTKRHVDPALAKQLASILGAHHGRPVVNDQMKAAHNRPFALGREPWADIREELLDWLADELGVCPHLAGLEGVTIPQHLQVVLCGLLVMADWMASNQDLFPLIALDADPTSSLTPESLAARANRGWGELGLPWAWEPNLPEGTVEELFNSRFGWQGDKTPHALQRAAVELARQEEIGLIIVEAEMGGGKTETALALAEILGAQFGAQGLFVALPTQATTDAMFARVEKWINRLPEEMADVPAWAMTLAHGKARLNPLYSAYVDAMDEAKSETLRFDQRTMQAAEAVHDDGEKGHDPASEGLSSVVAHEWFRGRKRRLLSTFGVGTIDQPLMAALEQKHLMVRHVALAGKVLIIDECHSSDTYMNQYVDRMLHWLGNYRSPVIMLSATLTHERKEAMIRAYAPDVDEVPQASGYPCLTWVDSSRSKAQTLAVEAKADPSEVLWDWIPDDDAAILQTLREELADGGCALVVRNTVHDAQRIATMIEEANIAPRVELTHSRFLASDRAAKDNNLVKVYGPGSGLGTRPEKSVVVGTQVVEQSLDVDFDVLITDLCPMDLLFQRIGRLHRHRWHQRPERLQQARVHVIGGPDKDGVLRGSGGSHRIYGDYHLLRTALLLQRHGSSLELPTDIAPLVQAALGSGSIEAPDSAWAMALRDAAEEFADDEAKSATKASHALLGEVSERPRETLGLKQWLKHADDFSELAAQAGVRDAQPSLEVIVALVDPEGLAAMSPPWDEDPVIIDTSSRPDDMTARRIATWTVKLPAWLTPGDRLEDLIKELSGQRKGWRWKDSPYLKEQPILVMEQQQEGVMVFEGEIAGRSGPVKLRYTPARGLEEVTE